MKTEITSVSQLSKAISVLGLILLLCVSMAFAGEIIKEDFEDTGTWGEWDTATSGGTEWAIDDDKKHAGSYSANCSDGEFTECGDSGTYLPNTASLIKKTYTEALGPDGQMYPFRDFVNLHLTFYYKCMGIPSWD